MHKHTDNHYNMHVRYTVAANVQMIQQHRMTIVCMAALYVCVMSALFALVCLCVRAT